MARTKNHAQDDLINAFLSILPERGALFANLLKRLTVNGFDYSLYLKGGREKLNPSPLFVGLPETTRELERALRKYAAPKGFGEARFDKFKLLEFRYLADWMSELKLEDPSKLSSKIPIFEIGRALSIATNSGDLAGLACGMLEMFDGVKPNLYRYHFKVEDNLVFESTWDGKGFNAQVYTAKPILHYVFALARKTGLSELGKITPLDVLRVFREMANAIRALGGILESRNKRIVAFGKGKKILHLGAGALPNMGPMFGPLELYVDRLLALV